MKHTGKWWFSPRLVVAVLGAVVILVVGLMQVADLYWLRHRGEVVLFTLVDLRFNLITRLRGLAGTGGGTRTSQGA